MTEPLAPGSSTFRKGQRVCRKDSQEQGTVVEANGHIKVKWDSGATSYLKRSKPGNVMLLSVLSPPSHKAR